jgi:hypothetical protein
VIKPLDCSADEIAWQTEVLRRSSRPASARRGRYLCDRRGGRWPNICPGELKPGRWREIIGIGKRFHTALAAVTTRLTGRAGLIRELDLLGE